MHDFALTCAWVLCQATCRNMCSDGNFQNTALVFVHLCNLVLVAPFYPPKASCLIYGRDLYEERRKDMSFFDYFEPTD